MDKSLKIAKLNIRYLSKILMWFYLFISAYLLFIVPNLIGIESITFGGIELFTFFIVVATGVDLFKENFHFSQCNNVSRKSLIKGLSLSIFPIAIAIASLDVLINRAINAFIKSPTLYDRILGNYGSIQLMDTWVQDNRFITIINTIVMLFILYCLGYIIGLLLGIIYYRSNNIIKVLILSIPFIVSAIINSTFLRKIIPEGKLSFYNINLYFRNLFNLGDDNILPAVIIYSIFFGGLYFITKLSVKKITIKKA